MDYLDTILDGNFEPETGEGKKMYALQMRYMDRAIACYEKAETTDARLKLAADIIAAGHIQSDPALTGISHCETEKRP